LLISAIVSAVIAVIAGARALICMMPCRGGSGLCERPDRRAAKSRPDPCLGAPDRIHAELFRFDHVVDLFVEVVLRPEPAADPDC